MEIPDNTEKLRQWLSQLSKEERLRLAEELHRTTPEAATPTDAPPLSYQQRNFWMLHQRAEHPGVYNNLLVIRLSGRLRRDCLQQALSALAHNYQIFRTVYVEDEGAVQGVLREKLEPEYVFRQWEGAEEAFEDYVTGELRNEALRPFALERESMFRACLYRLNDERHVLALVFHHIANDGDSYNLFWAALRNAYEAIAAGEAPPVPKPETQYGRFAFRQVARTESPVFKESLRYWVDQLRNAPVGIDFTYDYPGGHGPETEDSEVFLPVGDLEEWAGAVARAESTTRNVVYLTAYFAWLHRITGATDLTVGVPINGRMRREDAEVMGCCINMLSIRQRPEPDMTFRELVRQTRQIVLDAIKHADVPYLRLVEETGSAFQGSPGFYNTTFQYRNVIQQPAPLGGCTAEILSQPRRLSQFPLMLEVYPTHGDPRLSLTYHAHLFRKDTAERMLRQYRKLLDDAYRDPDQPLGRLRLMEAEERHLVVETWSRNRKPYPHTATVHALFAEQAQRRPDATALMQEDRQMTYAELDRRSSAIAAALQQRGAGPGRRVGLCLERSFDLITGLLAVLKTGAAYLPLDAAYPRSRLKFMVEDATVCAVLTSAAGRVLFDPGTDVLLIEELQREPAERLAPVEVAPDDPAYLMYTSGSTGRPKGVLIPHRGVVRLVKEADYADLSENETFLQLSSTSFDAATFEMWGALLNGARLALLPPQAPSLGDLRAAIRRHGVTILFVTTGLFHLMADEDPEAFRPLRQLLTGGDVLSPGHARRCMEVCPELRLINAYGPTENTTFSCCYTLTGEADFDAAVPVGKPIANSEAYVLDSQGRPVPVGVVGELFLGGDGCALGYWNRPDLNEERFVPHPFSVEPAAKLYRSGDMARFLPDGNLEFRGRRDQQVKVRGFRVELGEIESVLLKVPFVKQCVVTAPENSTFNRDLIAYLVLHEDEPEALKQARALAHEALPDYMMPKYWVALDQLPLTSNGKIDRKALPAPSRNQPGSLEQDKPVTQLEEQLLEIWMRLFQREDIGCQDDFLDLGGDSLFAMRLIAETRRLTEQAPTLHQLFQHRTIRDLAGALMADG